MSDQTLIKCNDALAIVRYIAGRQHYSRQALHKQLVKPGRINPIRVARNVYLYDPIEVAQAARRFVQKGGAA